MDPFFELGEDLLKAMLGFTLEDHGAAEDAVLRGLLRGGELAFRGGWAAGFSSVGSGGFGFA